MNASLPTVVVEVALTTNPTAAPAWTDVSAYVRALQIRRGRQQELDRISPGAATVMLANSDRRFDPTYTAGPYYGNLLPMRRIRISATWGGVTYRLYTGLIESWPQTWPGQKDALVPVQAVDALKVLGLRKLNTSYVQQNSGTRIGNILNDASWTVGAHWVLNSTSNSQLSTSTIVGPVGDRRLDNGVSTMQAVTLSDYLAIQAIEDVQAAENGSYYVDVTGAFVARNRHARVVETSSLATFGDAGGEYPYVDLVLNYDDSRIWNDIRIQRTGSTSTQTAADSTSQARYFPRTLARTSVQLAHVDGAAAAESEALSMAGWLKNTYGEPLVRIVEMTLRPQGNTSEWPVVLARELGDRISVNRTPPGGGNRISQASIIEGIEHDVRNGLWQTRFRLSGAPAGGHWLLGDAQQSQLSQTTVLVY